MCVPAMDFIRRNEIPMREEEVDKFRELQQILCKFLKSLVGVLAVKATDNGNEFFAKHPNVMMAMILMIVLYFLVWLLETILRHRGGSLHMILAWITLVLGSISSVLLLTVISSLIAWFTGVLWVGIFAATAYHYYHVLYELFVRSVSNAIRKLAEPYQRQGIRLPV